MSAKTSAPEAAPALAEDAICVPDHGKNGTLPTLKTRGREEGVSGFGKVFEMEPRIPARPGSEDPATP